MNKAQKSKRYPMCNYLFDLIAHCVQLVRLTINKSNKYTKKMLRRHEIDRKDVNKTSNRQKISQEDIK